MCTAFWCAMCTGECANLCLNIHGDELTWKIKFVVTGYETMIWHYNHRHENRRSGINSMNLLPGSRINETIIIKFWPANLKGTIVVDDMLRRLQEDRPNIQCYTDDLTVTIRR